MKKARNRHRSSFSLMWEGARTITLNQSVAGTFRHISKDGIASDWKRVGNDMRTAMTKVERERVW